MHTYLSDYARTITGKKIRYIPLCILIEIMTSVYGYITRIPITRRSLEEERSRIIEVLEILHNDLVLTLHAYESGRSNFFSGDWKSNRQAAQRLFAVLMDRLEKLHYFLWGAHQAQLKEFMIRLNGVWTTLYAFLDERCEHDKEGEKTRYFHSSDSEAWQKTMANIIAELYARTKDDGDDDHDFLLLLCCSKVKLRLLKQIEQLQVMRGEPNSFDGDCLLCVSHKDINSTCPLCMRLSDEILDSPKTQRHDTVANFPLHPAYRTALIGEEPNAAEWRRENA